MNGFLRFCSILSLASIAACTPHPVERGTEVPQPVPRRTSVVIDEEEDWAARSSAAGIVYANDFRADSEFAIGRFPDSRVDNVSWDNTRYLSGEHSLRFDIRKEDHANSGNWRVYLRPSKQSFSEGDEFYVQYRIYLPHDHLEHRYLGGGGWKTSIISAYYGSFTNFEVVMGNYLYRGTPQGYYRGKEPGDNSVRFVGWQPPGRVRWQADQWQTILQHVRVGNFGQRNSTVAAWIALHGKNYKKLFSRNNVQFGLLDVDTKGKPHTGFEALWLTPYDTRKKPDPTRQDTFVNYDQVIVSTEFIPAPGFVGSE